MSGLDVAMLAQMEITAGEAAILLVLFFGPSLLAFVGLILAFCSCKRLAIAAVVVSCVGMILALWLLPEVNVCLWGLPVVLGTIAVIRAYNPPQDEKKGLDEAHETKTDAPEA